MTKTKTKATNVAYERVKSIVERVERLEEERKAIGGDIRDIYLEAKGNGFDVKTIRWLVGERKIDVATRDERDHLRDTYALALGMAVNLVEVDGLSLRQAEKRTGVSKSSIQRAISVPTLSQGHKQTADGNPPSGGEGTADQPDGPGIASATLSEVAPNEDARAAQSLPLPDADGVSRAGTHSDAETGSATRGGERCGADESLFEPGLMGAAPARLSPPPAEAPPQPLVDSTDAARLRAQKASSTDPAWLEREATRVNSSVRECAPSDEIDPGPMPSFLRRTVSA